MSLEPNRLFFALWPGDAVRAAAAEAARTLRVRMPQCGSVTDPQRYHVTLFFLGHAVSADQQAAAATAAASVRATPFTLVLDQAGSFRSRNIPWWLGCREPPAGVMELHDRLRDALRRAGVTVDRTRFAPHLTILRNARQPLPPTPISPIEWPVAEFVLVRSRLERNPAGYEVIGRWPLRADEAGAPASEQMTLPL